MIRGLAFLTGGTALAQLISFAFLLYLARLYEPHSFGELGVAIAIAGLLATFVGLQMRQALILAKEPKDQSATALAFVLVAIVQLALLAMLASLLDLFIDQDSALGRGLDYTYALLILSAGAAWNVALQAICIRNERFFAAGMIVAAKSVAVCMLQALMAVRQDINGLIYGLVLGEVLVATVAGTVLLTGRRRLPLSRVALVEAMRALKIHKGIAVFATSREMLHSATVNIPIWAIAALYGQVAAGSFTMASRLLDAPVGLAGNAVRNMSLREFSDLARNDREILGTRLIFWIRWLLAGGALMFLVVVLFGEAGAAYVLGPGWQQAADYMIILVAWKAVAFCKAPASAFYYATAQDRFTLRYQVWSAVAMFAAIVAVSRLDASALQAVLSITAAGFMIDGFFITIAVGKSKLNPSSET